MARIITVVSILAALALASPAMAQKFENKDTATNRQDTTFGTRPGNIEIQNDGGPGNDSVISVHPKEQEQPDQNYDIGPILIQPQIYPDQ